MANVVPSPERIPRVAHDGAAMAGRVRLVGGTIHDGTPDDLAALIEALDLTEVTMVGHSTGGAKLRATSDGMVQSGLLAAVLIGAVPPVMVKSAAIRTDSNRSI